MVQTEKKNQLKKYLKYLKYFFIQDQDRSCFFITYLDDFQIKLIRHKHENVPIILSVSSLYNLFGTQGLPSFNNFLFNLKVSAHHFRKIGGCLDPWC